MKKILFLLMALFLVVTTGCAKIDSQINLAPDVKGDWKAKITSEVGPIPKTALEEELHKAGITNYTIEALNDNQPAANKEVTTSVQWQVVAPFENEAELRKIAAVAFGSDNLSETYVKQNEKDKSVTDVNLGTSRSGTTEIKIHGNVIRESMKNGVINKEGVITFQQGENVVFQYTSGFSLWEVLGITVGVVLLIVLGFFYFEYTKKKREM